jgi:hypothetical protein
MTTSLRELTSAAIDEITLYRSPDIDEFRAAINPVLMASGRSSISNDCVESICETVRFYYGTQIPGIEIQTSWSTRGCVQSSEYFIPAFIIDAEDPVYTAQLEYLTRATERARSGLQVARENVDIAADKLEQAEQALADFKSRKTHNEPTTS